MRLHFCILQVMEGVVGRPRNEASKCREKFMCYYLPVRVNLNKFHIGDMLAQVYILAL